MWNAAIVNVHPAKIAHLRACLQQTGIVGSVVEWNLPKWQEANLPQNTPPPDLVVLGLDAESESSLALAAELRKSSPQVRILAYSSEQQPDAKLILSAMRCGIQEFLSAQVTLAEVQEALARFYQKGPDAGKATVEKLILVMGSKGGVGTSTVAVNLSVQLTKLTSQRVLLMDFARPVGHVALLLDLQPRFTIRDAAENLERLDSHFLSGVVTRHKSGLDVLAGVPQTEEWERITPLSLPGVVNVAQCSYDFVVMDYGSVYSMDWLSGVVLRQARNVLLVAEPNVPSLWTLERHVAALSTLWPDPDRIRIVINRWTRGDDEALKGLEKKIKRPIFARLPNDFAQVSEAVNLGVPLSRNHNNPLVSRFQLLAAQLGGSAAASRPAKEARGGLFSFFQEKVKTPDGSNPRNRS